MTDARRYRGQRALRIAARTVHLLSMAVLFGSALYGEPSGRAVGWVLISGAVIVGDDLYKYGTAWLRFVQSWAVLAKLGLMLLALAVPTLAVEALAVAVVVGSVISHAPGRVRQAAIWGAAGPCAASKTGA